MKLIKTEDAHHQSDFWRSKSTYPENLENKKTKKKN